MVPALRPLAVIARLNHRLYLNCLADLDDALASRQPGDGVNDILFIALHVLDARRFLIRRLGGRAETPFTAMLAKVTSVRDLRERPPVEAVRRAWIDLEPRLLRRFAAVTATALAKAAKPRFPIDDPTVLGAVAFLLEHESYHIGQLGLLRKYLGLGPMKYA